MERLVILVDIDTRAYSRPAHALTRNTYPKVVARCRHAVELLEAKGATVVPIAMPHMKALQLAHGTKIVTEFALGYDARYHSGAGLEANTRITVGLGSTLTALEILAGDRLRAWAFDYMHSDIFGGEANVTALVSPTTGVTAPAISEAAMQTGESNNPLVMVSRRRSNTRTSYTRTSLAPESGCRRSIDHGVQTLTFHFPHSRT